MIHPFLTCSLITAVVFPSLLVTHYSLLYSLGFRVDQVLGFSLMINLFLTRSLVTTHIFIYRIRKCYHVNNRHYFCAQSEYSCCQHGCWLRTEGGALRVKNKRWLDIHHYGTFFVKPASQLTCMCPSVFPNDVPLIIFSTYCPWFKWMSSCIPFDRWWIMFWACKIFFFIMSMITIKVYIIALPPTSLFHIIDNEASSISNLIYLRNN